MGFLKYFMEGCVFVCNLQFWRMAVLWTLSLIFQYLRLLLSSVLFNKPRSYSRCSPKDSNLTPRVCVITGATSGLGAAAAYALSREGFCIVLVGRSWKRLSECVSGIKKRNPDAHLKAFEADLSSFKSILKFKSSLEQWLSDSNMHSSIQLLINNAGILATSCRLTSEGYDEMLATNYIGAFRLTKVLLPLLENSPGLSRVINVSSFTHWNVCCGVANKETITGMSLMKSKSYPYARIYEYSKLCLLAFSYELHRQVHLTAKSSHLSVLAVDPGAVETNILREVPRCISIFTFFVLKLFGILHSTETGMRVILDAALAPPEMSGVYMFGQMASV